MIMEEKIINAVVNGIKELWGGNVDAGKILLQNTRGEFKGNITVLVFPFLKLSKLSPDQTAGALGEYLRKVCPDVVTDFNVIKGFLNLVIASKCWIETLLNDYIDEDRDEKPLVMIEFSSPNTNKPLHLGHVRNNLLGESLSRIVEACGNRVVKTNIVNDRGIHICKSMLAWKLWGNGETPESAGKKGDHLIGDYYVMFSQKDKEQEVGVEEGEDTPLMKEAREMLVRWEQGDKDIRELWAKMNGWVYEGFGETYKALGVSFDKIYYESDTYLVGKDLVLQGLEKGLFYRRDDGSVWADLKGDGLDEKLLLRSDGTSVYMTQDIGTASLRFKDYPIDKMIYVVGNEQNYHFQVLSILLDRLGFKWGKDLVHFSYGMVELPNGKMKSREGTVVDADDLIATMIDEAYDVSRELSKNSDIAEDEAREIARKVGLGALKYFILKVDARKNMLFNPAESIDFNGNTGPFIQYAYARIQSILRKAKEHVDSSLEYDSFKGIELNDKEVSLIQKFKAFRPTVLQAGREYNPSLIANYCYELTKEFNQFYHDYSILNAESEELRGFRLLLAKKIGNTIAQGMYLLGIEMPERM
ncbi:MAG: arginine--tRNA ligase [Prevotellaceae bacterium]|nr:arginine--tRNA ligase [Candidatus Colivivens equi]